MFYYVSDSSKHNNPTYKFVANIVISMTFKKRDLAL